ncbi:MAG: hypothetical protein K5657_00345 [Desulfovibrio sp.]|nr:hypothetical protein [Desulfovibrio sp.]
MGNIKNLNVDIFRIFDEEWALLTAGTLADHNAMTISWGQLGSLWGTAGSAKNIVTVFVKPVRHTFSFMQKHEIFTVSWFPRSYRKDLGILGSKSGRDGNKIARTSLTEKELGGGVAYQEATRTLVARKIYFEQLKKDRIPDFAVETFYSGSDGTDPHYMFIGEVTLLEEK